MINVYYGTESGNSEMAADDIVSYLQDADVAAQVVPMEDVNAADLSDVAKAIVITSTYGDGELPETTQPFFDSLIESAPDLSHLTFAAFGLGDSTYETYGNGIDIVATKLTELGATQIGVTGRHDAAKSEALPDAANSWIESIKPLLCD